MSKKFPSADPAIVAEARRLASYYSDDSHVRKALEALADDLEHGKRPKKTVQGAKAALKGLDGTATAHRWINHLLQHHAARAS